MVSLGGYSPFNDYVNSLDNESRIYSGIQNKLSKIGATQSGLLRSNDPMQMSKLTFDMLQLSQEAQANRMQKELAENAISQEQADLNKILFDLFNDQTQIDTVA